jgi:DNA modification methylase
MKAGTCLTDGGHNTKDLSIEHLPITTLRANPRNARTHNRHQRRVIARSIRRFGFLNPILVDRDGMIVAGHGRVEAARQEGITHVPVIRIEHLNPDEIRAYAILENRSAELAGWDKSILAIELQNLMSLDLDFDVTITGFDIPEIDLIIEGAKNAADKDDEIEVGANPPAITRLGDVWQLGRHRIACADALVQASYDAVLQGTATHVVFTDPPYNTKINGHVSGNGRVQHREFVQASGEMTTPEYRAFLDAMLKRLAANSAPGAILFICLDWRHVGDLLPLVDPAGFELKNICVWVKGNAGMGSFYRSQHEFVFVLKHGDAKHRNNIQLGRFGRNRSNVWNYASPSAFGRSGEEDYLAALHPTVKPVQMIADALLDCTARGDIVLDSFLGSGSTLLAAERVGRICAGLELDPLYVDVAIRRWQRHTGDSAIHIESGKRFDDFVGEAANV